MAAWPLTPVTVALALTAEPLYVPPEAVTLTVGVAWLMLKVTGCDVSAA